MNLFDGSAKMRAKSREIVQGVSPTGIILITRTAYYKDDIATIDEYIFDGGITDVEQTPVSHKTTCVNCVGKILHFEYRDILYTGETTDITSPFSFGHRMKLEWQDGSYYAKVFQQKTASDKIILRYRPTQDREDFYIRLFDPILSTSQGNLTYNINSKLNDTNIDQNFAPNGTAIFALVNFSNNVTMQSGNYSWNYTEYNISTNLKLNYTYKFFNNGSTNFTVSALLNTSLVVLEVWVHDNNTKRWNLSNSTYTDLFNLTTNTTRNINVTIDLLNISQTYKNWTLNTSTSDFPFNISFNISSY